MEGIAEGAEDKILSKSNNVSISFWIHWIPRWGFDEQRKVPYPLMFINVKWCSSSVPNAVSLLHITVLCWCPALTTGQIAQDGQEMKCLSPGANPAICLWCCSWRNPELLQLVSWGIPAVVFQSWSLGQADHYKGQYFPCGSPLMEWSEACFNLSICLTFWVIEFVTRLFSDHSTKKNEQAINHNIDGPNASVWGRAVLEISQHGLEVGQSGKD